jgi:hypothetical protein
MTGNFLVNLVPGEMRVAADGDLPRERFDVVPGGIS